MITFGAGRLKFGNGYITDGVIYYKSLCPYLWKVARRNKRNNSILGVWVAIGSWIIAFKKERGK